MDDNSSLAQNREYAQQICSMIGEQDPNGRIQWEIDFPESGNFDPFLDTEVKIETGGHLVSRYYRKPQNKDIILHAKSHHPQSTKEEVLKNFYKTACEVSSAPEETLHSIEIVDDLAKKNGYKPQRPAPQPTARKRKRSNEYKAPLKPRISRRKYLQKSGLISRRRN